MLENYRYTIKKYSLLDKFKPFSFITLLFAIIFAISAYYNPPINMGYRVYNNIFLFYLAGVCGSIVVLKLISLFSSVKVIASTLSYIGRESLIILIFHGGLFLYATGVIENRLGIPIHWSIDVLVAIVGSLVVAEIVKKVPILNFLLNGKYNKKTITSDNKILVG